ncbi:M23 family metallopeptidase [Demequina sp.]|uniref:murein hydrolase activator EnvC family protein n=1 Tax=Demequina sp. TaxID=2050685 RepID=UPI0025C17E89|nr:M23 family metallopeptidase [Demequina sp.]
MDTPIRHRRRLAMAAAVACLALVSVTPAQGAVSTRFVSPVEPFSVARLASLPAHDWLPGHRGIDLTTSAGRSVTAPAAGEVTYAGVVVNRPLVSIRHMGGFVSSFEPVDAVVRVGDVLGVGDQLGTISTVAGHCAPATCVHWGLRRDGRYVNPLDYLDGFGPVRLLPLDGWAENAA